MSGVNWQLGVMPDIAGNALAAFQSGQQARQRADYQNALLENQRRDNERADAELKVKQGEAANQASERQRAQMVTLAKLYAHAAKGPEQFAQAKAAAVQLFGPNALEGVPEQFDPQWIGSQLLIAESMARDGVEHLSGIARELQDAGYEPGTPEFNEAMRGVINNKYASDYVDEAGNTRRRSALNLPTGQGGPQPGAVEDGYRFKGGNPADPNAWEPVGQGGPQGAPAGTFPG